jgi:hypothetical protein
MAAAPGGYRPRSGRHPHDSVWVGCAIARPVFNELVRQEAKTGIYRTRILAHMITNQLLGGIVDRELRAVRTRSPEA